MLPCCAHSDGKQPAPDRLRKLKDRQEQKDKRGAGNGILTPARALTYSIRENIKNMLIMR
jgi:hypothetical protein